MDRIRFVYRHFPLEGVHPHAMHAAEKGESAGAQGRFWSMHDLLYENQAHLKLHQLRGCAERLRLDMARYTFEMDDHVYRQRVRASPPTPPPAASPEVKTGFAARRRRKHKR